jgi:serine/threonine-protein kinase
MQLRHEEPLPPSKLLPKLSRDLETICLKALQKEPEKRYTTAAEFAEDLRRFRAGEPILARAVGRAERVWRWCRRKPVVAGLLAAVVVTLLGGTATSTWFGIDARSAAAATALARDDAEAKRQLAEESAELARSNERLAEANADLARQQRDHALTAFHTIVERVPTELRNVPGTEEFKRRILMTAMDGLNRVADAGGDVQRDFVLAKANAKVGEGLLDAGLAAEARAQFERSHKIIELLAETDAKTPRSIHLLRLGRSYRNLGKAAERLEGPLAAEPWHLQALRARQEALPIHDDALFVKQEIAESFGELGHVATETGRPRQALDWTRRAAEYREEWISFAPQDDAARREQAGTRLALGYGYLSLGDVAAAAEHYRKAVETLEPLSMQGGATLAEKANLAFARDFLASAYLFAGEDEKAKAEYRLAAQTLRDLLAKAPENAAVSARLAQALYGLSVVLTRLDEAAAAAEALAESLAIRQGLAEKAADDLGFQQALMLALARSGRTEEALRIAQTLRDRAPDDPGMLYQVACAYAMCSAAGGGGGFADAAIELLRAAVQKGYNSTGLLALDPDLEAVRGRPEFQRLLGEVQRQPPVVAEKP